MIGDGSWLDRMYSVIAGVTIGAGCMIAVSRSSLRTASRMAFYAASLPAKNR